MTHSNDVLDSEQEFYDNEYGDKLKDPKHFEEAEKAASVYDSPLCSEESRHLLMKECVKEHLGDIKGKKVLVMGGGMDCAAIWFAAQGCDTTVIDISNSGIKAQEILAKHAGVSITTAVDDGNSTSFDDASFDLIFGKAVLHHLDTEKASSEILRLLKPKGRAVFRDVMQGGIFLQLFRHLTPSVRTRDEHPLTMRDLSIYKDKFPHFQSEHFCYIAVAYLGVVRVWDMLLKKLVGKHKAHLIVTRPRFWLVHFLDRIDRILFGFLPFLKYHGAWFCIVAMRRS